MLPHCAPPSILCCHRCRCRSPHRTLTLTFLFRNPYANHTNFNHMANLKRKKSAGKPNNKRTGNIYKLHLDKSVSMDFAVMDDCKSCHTGLICRANLRCSSENVQNCNEYAWFLYDFFFVSLILFCLASGFAVDRTTASMSFTNLHITLCVHRAATAAVYAYECWRQCAIAYALTACQSNVPLDNVIYYILLVVDGRSIYFHHISIYHNHSAADIQGEHCE